VVLAAIAPNQQLPPSTGGAETPSGVGLVESDFELINENGFGDGFNGYAHSMAWFENKLYVGTSRAQLAGIKANKGDQPKFTVWPSLLSEDSYDVDRRAEIWQYNPINGKWKEVYKAMWVKGAEGRPVPRFSGFRGMRVYQGPRDPKPCLYVSSWTLAKAGTPSLLRTEDGEHFEIMPRPTWSSTVTSFRSLQPFKGRLHTSPTGSSASVEGQRSSDIGGDATVYCTEDIRQPNWRTCSSQGMGDPRNLTIFEMGTYDNHLYASFANPWTGLQLFKTDGEEGPPYKWKKVMERGAARGPFNEGVAAICEFKGALYVSTGVANGGYHRQYGLGPAAPELIRLYPDDSWELLVGYPRTTPQGVKVPLSGYSGGFDSIFNGYIWRMHVHDGWLYAGTFNSLNVLPYLPTQVWPDDVLRIIDSWGLDRVQRYYGGCELWRSNDGIHWHNVTRNCFGNKFNWGIRNMTSTPHGIFVGTCNVYGTQVAVKKNDRWQYVPNPRGGTEIWLGKPRNKSPQSGDGRGNEATAKP
jgi:hypothetical protein